ncbi:tRNA pseudouridine(13) synthase TruD [Bacterioplanes sanyensis]|uniref:tRNA pseudouridine synthase D n=1 Tax=Bacterioplanes sanyensis TaxID=1249553 RepID=A0A222FJK0_9GAMM|nr:tRNA pseudouridine(13) synthase TruD [Bacterioplanes sanyensis]ASP38766.1 tRNA pseudouridine(13) synthase TruD [Bacterioplanes sanyensis]
MTEFLLPDWPKAYLTPQVSGQYRVTNADFCVTELPLEQPSDEGEHVWLEIEKNGANTAWVAKRLAELAGVRDMDVGYAGLKDRHAITRQWFSIYLPRVEAPDFSQLNDDEMQVLSQQRHVRKLRRGDLAGNEFRLHLRHLSGDIAALDAVLQQIKAQGVPNYFGEQRFGHGGHNVVSGLAMLRGEFKVKNRNKRSLYLSAVRSLLFNQVIASRMQQPGWLQALDGDVLDEQGLITAPLWGRGRLASSEQALALETAVADEYREACDGMEHAGLKQERRAIVSQPLQLQWQQPQSDELVLSFILAPGHYATSVLRELGQFSSAAQRADQLPSGQ